MKKRIIIIKRKELNHNSQIRLTLNKAKSKLDGPLIVTIAYISTKVCSIDVSIFNYKGKHIQGFFCQLFDQHLKCQLAYSCKNQMLSMLHQQLLN